MLDSKSDSDNFAQTTSDSTNSTPAVKRSSPKEEEEISIEDIPF
jgi:hypothetical protein